VNAIELSLFGSPAKMAEPIVMLFGLCTLLGPRKHLLEGAHWRNLANAIEPFMCGGDAAFLPNYFDHLLLSLLLLCLQCFDTVG